MKYKSSICEDVQYIIADTSSVHTGTSEQARSFDATNTVH